MGTRGAQWMAKKCAASATDMQCSVSSRGESTQRQPKQGHGGQRMLSSIPRQSRSGLCWHSLALPVQSALLGSAESVAGVPPR